MARRYGVRRMAAALVVSGVGMMLMNAPVFAASAPGLYTSWSKAGSNGAFTGVGAPAAAGFPVASFTSNASTVQTPSGSTTFLGPDTPVGAKYGSSQDMSYLNVSTAPGLADSTTTVTFAKPTPASHWAFAVGDVDADIVRVIATGADGNPVPTSSLGFAGTFNYCSVSPKPGSCVGPGPFTDVPTWQPGASRLVGNGPDTFGASGWFEPTEPLSSITFTFSQQVGFPIFQLWITTLAVPVEADIEGITPDNPPATPVILDLVDDQDKPVIGPDEKPAEAIADDTGKAVFPDVVDGDYVVKIVPGKSAENRGKSSADITVDVTKGPTKIPAGTFAVFVQPVLPITGSRAGMTGGVGLTLVLSGGVLLFIARRRTADRP